MKVWMLIIVLAAITMAGPGVGQAAEPIVIRFSHVVAEDTQRARLPYSSSAGPKN